MGSLCLNVVNEKETTMSMSLYASSADYWKEQAELWKAEAEKSLAEIKRLRVVLENIEELDPAINSTNGFNEWGEADCFIQAQQLARDALTAPSV